MIFIRTCLTTTLVAAAPILAQAQSASEIAQQSVPAESVAPSTDNVVHFGNDNQPTFVDNSKDVPARTVFVEMSSVAAAHKYEVQVRPFAQRWVKALTLATNEPQLRLRLTPGHYSLRTRSLAENGAKGTWGRWKEFRVNFKPPTNVVPADGTVIPPMGNKDEKITFEWPKIEFAKFYLFLLKDKNGTIIEKVVTPQTWFVARLAVKSDYTWSVTPLSAKEDATNKSLEVAWHGFSVDEPNETLRSVFFEIDAVKKVKNYQFEFVKFTGDNQTTEPSVYDSFTNDVRIRLGPGAYEVRARSVFEDDSKSDWNAPQRFYVEIPAPTLIAPKDGIVLEPTDHEHSKVTLKWKKIREAERYQVTVFKDSGEIALNVFTKDNEFHAELPHETKYHWQVIAYNPGEKDKGPGSDRWPAAEGENKELKLPDTVFSIDTYIKLELTKAEEPSQLYAWANHRSSMVDYMANNYDNGTALTQSMFGGTGELALGYWYRKTNYGLVGSAALSGVTIQNQTFTYSSFSLLGGKRYKLSGSNRLRWWLGATYRETPEIQSDLFVTNITFAKIAGYGPEARISYMFDVTNEIGGHLFGQVSYVSMITETPNGQPGINPLAYGFGIQGTKKLDNGWIGALGYSYQAEQTGYGSFDQSGKPNVIQYGGHFLTLGLMFGLEEAYR